MTGIEQRASRSIRSEFDVPSRRELNVTLSIRMQAGAVPSARVPGIFAQLVVAGME
jgi:hypothetical protein